MVVCPTDAGLQADVVFVVEGTAVNGAYINDIKSNYITPSLEYFSQGNIDENNYIFENANSLYGIVIYQAADCLPHPSSETFGPFSSPSKVLAAIDKLELIGGKGESHANIAEGLATALCCFEELQQKRDPSTTVQKHCLLICNSPPYQLPVLECQPHSGKTAEQLAVILQEKNINLSIISPRKIPSLYKLFEKAGGDLTASQTKNYAKDPRHLVLLKGFSLKERPISPPPGAVTSCSTQQLPSAPLPITSLPSPLPSSESPISNTQQNPNMIGINHMNAPLNNQVCGGRVGSSMGIQPMPAPPGYHATTGPTRPPMPWTMPPQQSRNYSPGSTTTSGSALIAQLTQPPSTGVNTFGQMGNNSPINKMNMNQQPNVQTSMAQNPMIQTSMAQVSQSSQANTSQAQSSPQTPQIGGRERHTIWQGLLEWIEKPKNEKITKHVPCQVSANSKEGEPEIKADGWPSKLIMQLMPKLLIGNIGGAYLKNSKSVLFHPQQCEALESLTRVMASGFAGCVHFTSIPNNSACDIKVLILLYTVDKKAYLGFIPNDQVAFVDRLRKVIQQQKSTQHMRQVGSGGPSVNQQSGAQLPMGSAPPQMSGVNSPATSQNNQQNLLISQTNTLSMGGGQITQNTNGSGPSNQPIGGLMGQNVAAGGMRPNIRMQGIQQGIQQGGGSQQGLQGGLMGGPVPRAPFEDQLQVERQQNLEKINKLKQTLEAAQQQEQQYKSQLERISHMKTSQLQEALQIAQQTEMQFKMMDQQRMTAQANPQAVNPQQQQQQQQQRMMRPIMANNPGLRHLLQQQPQYRQQLINMQQIGGNGPRGQMGQQMPNASSNQTGSFDDVPNFDFNNIM